MPKSRWMLLGCAGMALAACDGAPPQDAVFFKDGTACLSRFDALKCTKAHDEAAKAYDTYAPVLMTQEECENQFGRNNCTARYMPSNRPYYAPSMMGFLTDGGSFSEPVYSERDGTGLVLRGKNLYKVGTFMLPPPALVPDAKGRRTTVPSSPHDYVAFERMPAEQGSQKGWEGR